jgi:tetratricopeptide (TPR) repeat protein
VDVSTYVRLYDQQWDDLMESDSESGSPLVDYKQGSIGTTWTISLKAVEARNKNAANLLRLWAFLDNKDVWFGLLHSAVARNKDWPQWLVDVACDEAKFLDAARLLLRYSMIESQESEPGSYIMHPVVHRWTAHIQNSREKREHIPLAVTVVGLSAPARMTKGYWVFGRRLLGHMGSCSYWIQRLRGDDRSMPMAFFLAIHMLGQLYRIHGRLEEAESMYRRALQGQEKTVGLEDRSTLRTVNALGTVYRDQGQLERAEALYTRVLWCKEKLLGPDHSSTLAAVNNLGLLYVDLGRLDQAEALLTRALQGQEKTLGLNDISTLGTVNALGSLCKKQGQLERAGALYTRGLRGTEKILGPDHPSTLKTVHTLGAFFAYQGRVEQAEALFTRALGGREKVLGVHHPSTVNTVISLGDLYLDHGRLEQAEALLTRALGGEGKIFGPDHPSTLHVVYNLGLLYKKQGRLEEAEVMSRRARSGFQKAEGPPDPRREHSLEMLHSPKGTPFSFVQRYESV